MPIWILKAFVQKIISFLPYNQKVNYLFQKYITHGVQLGDEYLTDRLNHFKNHYSFFKNHTSSTESFTVLELGTGWYPVIPICFFLSGAEKIYTLDISSLVTKNNFLKTAEKLIQLYEEGKLSKYVEEIKPARIQNLKQVISSKDFSLSQMASKVNVNLLVKDARNTGLQDNSLNFITSNNTFEHIYPTILSDILIEFKRILIPDFIMSHFIDMSDHFAHLDKSINVFNFLRFSEKQWKLIDNTVQPQNRMRINQYKEIFNSLKINIIKEEDRIGRTADLSNINLTEPFNNMSEKDLIITHSHVVLK